MREMFFAKAEVPTDDQKSAGVTLGVVYLAKSGRYFKLGRTNHAGCRQYEIDLQLRQQPLTS